MNANDEKKQVIIRNIEYLLTSSPYAENDTAASDLFSDTISELFSYHLKSSELYRNIIQGLSGSQITTTPETLADLPFLPVNLFKELDLKSSPTDQIVKTMTSSGTSGQVSKIYLDKDTARYQGKVLNSIVSSFIGNKRIPLLVIDSEKTVKDRNYFSARTAAIQGFSLFGKKPAFALNDDFTLNEAVVRDFFEQYSSGPYFVFGFTALVYFNFLHILKERNLSFKSNQGTLIHGGGWKKLQDQAVSNEQFKAFTQDTTGIQKVHNYYGMVEQTGSIFFECEEGHLHCSKYSDVYIRRADFSLCEPGEAGLIQVLSLLPLSYPGFNLLTEDMGEITSMDNCPCGRSGKTFKVHGRAKRAAIRGCSDVQY
ncbi:MAG: hypothetical protein MI867_14050 [Pseudomonadales bacterium]|nr:hypothetical protein [Pseudomonadales bacterium]